MLAGHAARQGLIESTRNRSVLKVNKKKHQSAALSGDDGRGPMPGPETTGPDAALVAGNATGRMKGVRARGDFRASRMQSGAWSGSSVVREYRS
jgi:hypothetical protein